ncbi:MAG: LysR family transcriptional regulator [Gammaproteobacteria bacterium]|nr:LysR family transcriptional regulator [Gammaproteobacteria bacterium]
MDIDRLHIFLDAAQTLNYSETAKRMLISQSTVSKHIRDFEQELAVILFERGGARLRLSQAGEALIPWARQLVRECDRFQEMAHSLQEGCRSGDCPIQDQQTAASRQPRTDDLLERVITGLQKSAYEDQDHK